MSISRMSAVFKHSKQTDNRRLLMLALADSANDTGHAWPGQAKLESKTAMERRAIIRHTETILATSNELMLWRRPGRGNHYLILVGMTQAERLEAVRDFCKELGITLPDLAEQHRDAVQKYHSKDRIRNTRKWQTSDQVITTPKQATSDQVITSDNVITGDHLITTTSDHVITPVVITWSHDPSMNHQYDPSVKEIRGTHSANGPDGPALSSPFPHVISGIDLSQTVPAILDALAHQDRDTWQAVLFAEQHTPARGKPRTTLITAIQDELSPVRKMTADETGLALELAQVIAECAYLWSKPVVGGTRMRCMGQVKQVILDLTESGQTVPTPEELRTAYGWYMRDGTKAPRDAVKIVGMVLEYRGGKANGTRKANDKGRGGNGLGACSRIGKDDPSWAFTTERPDAYNPDSDPDGDGVSDLLGSGLVHRGLPERGAEDGLLHLPGRAGNGSGADDTVAGSVPAAGHAAR